jgi:hypothetical protein
MKEVGAPVPSKPRLWLRVLSVASVSLVGLLIGWFGWSQPVVGAGLAFLSAVLGFVLEDQGNVKRRGSGAGEPHRADHAHAVSQREAPMACSPTECAESVMREAPPVSDQFESQRSSRSEASSAIESGTGPLGTLRPRYPDNR